MKNISKSNIIINMLLVLFSVMFCFFIFEIYLRLFTVQETKRLAIYDKDLGWRGQPNGKGIFIRKKDDIWVDYKYNEYGFRDENISTGKDFSTRIVLTGDSFVEGLEVEYENTFHRIVENRLKTNVDKGIEVINLSSQGYSTAQELLALRKYQEIIKPNIVLLVFYTGNDFTDNLRRKFAYIDKDGNLKFNKNNDPWLKVKYLSFKRWMYENSYLVFFLKNFIESVTHLRIADDTKKVASISEDDKYKITELLLLEMKNEVENNNAMFGVVIIPSKSQIANNDYRDIQRIVEFCKNREIPYGNLYDVLSLNHYFEYDEHLNTLGHSAVSKEIYELLLSKFELVRKDR